MAGLYNRGFVALIVTQFFGAMNDNVLKGVLTFMVIDGLWSGGLGPGGQGIVGICFTVPFLLLSGYAGQLADRYSKRDVTWWVKTAEIPIAIVAGIGFWTGNLWITLVALVALTCQSAFFGPAKYGMIPELVDDGLLSKANGSINMMTNLAVIIGTLVAGGVSTNYFPRKLADAAVVGQPTWWLPLAVLVAISVGGWLAAQCIRRLPAKQPGKTFDWRPLTVYRETVAEMAQTRLLLVMLAWGYFYLLAGIALFILPEYAMVLGVTDFEASVLMGVLGVAVGLGCAVAGFVSGNQIRPRLVPLGAAGLVFFFVLLGWIEPQLGGGAGLWRVLRSNVAWMVLGAGFSAGFYIVPLQALLQKWSPEDRRGRYLGTANAVSFTFMTLSAVLYVVIRGWFGDSPHHIFLVCSGLMAVGAGFFLVRLRGTGIAATV